MGKVDRVVIVGFLGCGNVGSGVWRLLESFDKDIKHRTDVSFRIKKVLVRNLGKDRSIAFPEGVLTERVEDVLEDP